jgi:hypothetical protein
MQSVKGMFQVKWWKSNRNDERIQLYLWELTIEIWKCKQKDGSYNIGSPRVMG